ncbi:hypothetical protein [Caulobacter sp. NIBR1757]|uniref:hypothetical protein n=1 Tax=Caulobacter sp. NIBR1757 TaxID=3016000 RepID=UPI0022F08668|nr:hypothetical protein [Caulobacter sp. NIBR1757]WGM37672.1 hypothetical protein AMEJIAPC_00571 [Caulobacter sp. NIBR1757]
MISGGAMVSPFVTIEQIVLGPRDQGRNYGELAASPGLALPASALAALRDFSLRIVSYVPRGGQVHAAFKISEAPGPDLWAVMTTAERGRIQGNPVIVTWALIVPQAVAEQAQFKIARFLPFVPVTDHAPALGSALEAVRVEVKALLAKAANQRTGLMAHLSNLVFKLRREPVVLSLIDGLDPVGTLTQLLGMGLQATNAAVSFITVPAPLRRWDLVVFRGHEWTQVRDAKVFGLSGLAKAEPADDADKAWFALLKAIEDRLECGGPDGSIALEQASMPLEGESPAGRVNRRINVFLDSQSEDRRLDWLIRLVRAAANIDAADRAAKSKTHERFGDAIVVGVLASLEAAVMAFRAPAATISDGRLELLEAELARIDVATERVPRLVAKCGAVFLLTQEVIDRLAERLVINVPTLMIADLKRGAAGLPSNFGILLETWQAAKRRGQSLWDLGMLLADRIVCQAWSKPVLGRVEDEKALGELPDARARKLLDGYLGLVASEGRVDAAWKLLDPAQRDPLLAMVGEAGTAQLVRAARRRLAAAGPMLREDDFRFSLVLLARMQGDLKKQGVST